MNSAAANAIHASLAMVETERALRAADRDLAARVMSVKAYQQRRFELTYADLLQHPRYGGAANFFLREIYGPSDFTQRDQQFARIVPALIRLFPDEAVAAVEALAALHALSERFDSAMARVLPSERLDADGYAQAWQRCDDAPGRDRQIALLLRVGRALDGLTRSSVLRHSLKLMGAPARVAGMAALHAFLEAGFDNFRSMRGADEFLALIGERERALAKTLFSVAPGEVGRLGQLP